MAHAKKKRDQIPQEKDIHCLPMIERLKRLFESPTFSDCCFIFMNDGNRVQSANKLILSVASPVFRAMFFGELANDQPIKIDDISASVFKLMLQFIYTGKCNFTLYEGIEYDLYYAAEKYNLLLLKNKCLTQINFNLCALNACKTYEWAKFFEIESLMEHAENVSIEDAIANREIFKNYSVMLTQTNLVLTSADFLDCQLSTLLSIFSGPLLTISSEFELLAAAENWGRNECRRRGLPEDQANLRNILDEPLKKIRFLTFSAAELVEGHIEFKILNENEFISLLVNIITPNTTGYAVPEGFSNITKKRCNSLHVRHSYSKSHVLFPVKGAKANQLIDGEVPDKIVARMKHLLDSQELTDTTFVITGQDSLLVAYSAHKLILSMSSPVFQKMLAERTANDGPIQIADTEPHYFQLLLDFIYTDHCQLPKSQKELIEFALVVFKFCVPLLLEECCEEMIAKLTDENVFELYEAAEYFELPENHRIYDVCLQHILLHSDAIFKKPSFEDIQLKTLLTMLRTRQRDLNISGPKLFASVVRWARKECKRRNLPEDCRNLRTTIDAALKEIHFLDFSAEDFAKGPGESEILTKDEFHKIVMNILYPATGHPMPDGFSTEQGKKTPHFRAKSTLRYYDDDDEDANDHFVLEPIL